MKRLISIVMAVVLVILPGVANVAHGWNKAGHMVSGAIAYAELRQQSPESLRKVLALLNEHPEYDTRWAPILNAAPADQRDLYLFMLAARWPDDVRGEAAQHRDYWHYINFPYQPAGQPDSVRPAEPRATNILTAIEQNLNVIRGGGSDVEKAVAICC